MKRGRLVFAFALVACRKETMTTAVDAGPAQPVLPYPSMVPAPNSPLAIELGTDDAGWGLYRFYDDGPACGRTPKVARLKALGDSVQSVAFFETESPPAKEPDSDARSPARIQIVVPTRVVEGASFNVAATMINASKAPFVYQAARDGSFPHWVSPFIDLYLRANDTGKTYRWTYSTNYGRCGNMNSRTAEDFVTVAPGDKKKNAFGDWGTRELNDVVVAAAGRYTLWIVYSACDGPARRGDGVDAPIPNGTFDGMIASNGIVIEVSSPPH